LIKEHPYRELFFNLWQDDWHRRQVELE